MWIHTHEFVYEFIYKVVYKFHMWIHMKIHICEFFYEFIISYAKRCLTLPTQWSLMLPFPWWIPSRSSASAACTCCFTLLAVRWRPGIIGPRQLTLGALAHTATQGICQQSTRWMQRSPSHQCSTTDNKCQKQRSTRIFLSANRKYLSWEQSSLISVTQDSCSCGVDPVGDFAAMLHCYWLVQTPWGLVEVPEASRHKAETYHCDHCWGSRVHSDQKVTLI